MKHKKLVAGVAIVAMLCIPVAAKLIRGSGPAKDVETDKIGYREIKSSILASGHLLYDEQVMLSPEVIGKVSTIYVKEGQQVTKGDLLLHLDDQTYRAEVAQQEAVVRQQRIAIEQQQLSVQNQESQYRRKVELHKMKMLADSAIDDARFALDAAKIDLRNSRSRLEQVEATLKLANERLSKTTVRAPISGTITALDIKVGETAVASQVSIAGSTLMTIANTATMLTEVNVDEADIAKVAVGQEVAITTAAYPDTALTGRVLSIPLSPKQNPAAAAQGGSKSRNYDVKVELLDTKKLALRPGMSVRAEVFISSNGKSLALPLQAVLTNNEESTEGPKKNGKKKNDIKTESWVYVAKDGKAEKRVVTTGASDDSMQEIRSGLANGETVIIGPYKVLRQLKQGDVVAPVAKPAQATQSEVAAKPAAKPAAT
ncbi:efflux RND transporter periplasmic adaptor subunit [Massilia sp. DD77]|uniref:efflux RND transporter periplasmic adaptor subunit n=1 Tax=Massilia sp. DD77 TaxID=3109349 RepID=UPI002FFE16E5